MVVGSASSSAEAVGLITDLHPDVTLVDIDLGPESGIELVEHLHGTAASSPLILISAHSADDFHDPDHQQRGGRFRGQVGADGRRHPRGSRRVSGTPGR